MSWISFIDYAWTYLKRTQLLCMICTVCEQPALVCPCLPLSVMVNSCHACVNLSRLRSLGFTPTLRSAVALHRRDSGLACTKLSRTFDLHEIFKCGHLKFTVYGHKQADIHTHNFRKCSHATVGLAQARPNYGQTWVSPVSRKPNIVGLCKNLIIIWFIVFHYYQSLLSSITSILSSYLVFPLE